MTETTTLEPCSTSYNEVEKFIQMICHRFSERTGYDFDSLLSSANLAYVKALEKFDPSKGIKFITYLGKSIRNELLTHIKQENKFYSRHILSGSAESFRDKTDCFFSSDLSDIPEEAKQMVSVILDSDRPSPKTTITNMKKSGWKNKKIKLNMTRIKNLIG